MNSQMEQQENILVEYSGYKVMPGRLGDKYCKPFGLIINKRRLCVNKCCSAIVFGLFDTIMNS